MRKRITLLITALPQQPGKNENQPKFFQQESQKGSFNSSHPTETECGTPCPPGQFK